MDQIWLRYDVDGNGVLDRNEAKRFIKDSLHHLGVDPR